MSTVIRPKGVPLVVEPIVGDARPLIIRARMTRPTAPCPPCHHASARIHRGYWRSPQDLPWRTVPIRWHLAGRKFWCDTPGCPQRIFCERRPAARLGSTSNGPRRPGTC
jgi:hypothetical protein